MDSRSSSISLASSQTSFQSARSQLSLSPSTSSNSSQVSVIEVRRPTTLQHYDSSDILSSTSRNTSGSSGSLSSIKHVKDTSDSPCSLMPSAVRFYISDNDDSSDVSQTEPLGETSNDPHNIEILDDAQADAINKAIIDFTHFMQRKRNTDINRGYKTIPIEKGSMSHILLYQDTKNAKLGRYGSKASFSCAFKYAKEKTKNKTTIDEQRILRKIKHENIITLLASFQYSRKTILVLERGQRSLQDVLETRQNGLDEDETRVAVRDIAKALAYFNTHNIVHGDLKTDNVLRISANLCKVCDLALGHIGDAKKKPSSRL